MPAVHLEESPMLRILFPSVPYFPNELEPMFERQWEAAEAAGLLCSRFDDEALRKEERLAVRPPAAHDELLLLRGWMLTPADYECLAERADGRGWRLLTTPGQYRRCHWLSGWYEQLRDLTARTHFQSPDAEYTLQGAYFMKDEVKSCSARGVPRVESAADFARCLETMREFGAPLQGQLCLREWEQLQEEHRFFVIDGGAHGFKAPAAAQQLADEVARRIDAPFFTVDVARRSDGAYRVVELGDGQVSDLKEWEPAALYRLLSAAQTEAEA